MNDNCVQQDMDDLSLNNITTDFITLFLYSVQEYNRFHTLLYDGTVNTDYLLL